MDNLLLRWKIGEVEISRILEMEENELFSSFIPNAIPENIKNIKWLIPNFASENGQLKAYVQSFLIKSNGKNILIDTGNGNGKNRPNLPTWGNLQTDYLNRFIDSGISPDEVDIVVCTHLHFDHVGWNTKLENGKWVPTFPNATYIFSQGEYDYWINKPEKEMIDDLNGIDDSITPVVNAGLAKFISDDYLIDNNIRFVSTPGHTPHHVSVAIESQGKKAFIMGDIMLHPCQITFPDWTSLSDGDSDKTIQTRKQFINEVINTDTLLFGAHFSGPVVGKIVQIGDEYLYKVI